MTNSRLYKYLDSRIGKIYKILPLKEEKSDTLELYLRSLRVDLRGAQTSFRELNEDIEFQEIINVLNGMIKEEYNVALTKTLVFGCIQNIKSIRKRYCEEG